MGGGIVFQPNQYIVKNYIASELNMMLYMIVTNAEQGDPESRVEPDKLVYLKQLKESVKRGDRNILLFGKLK